MRLSKIHKSNEFLITIIDIGNQCIESYEKYLLDKDFHNSLAKNIKKLKIHINGLKKEEDMDSKDSD